MLALGCWAHTRSKTLVTNVMSADDRAWRGIGVAVVFTQPTEQTVLSGRRLLLCHVRPSPLPPPVVKLLWHRWWISKNLAQYYVDRPVISTSYTFSLLVFF